MSAWLLEQVEKLCGRSKEYAEAYRHPGGHRTSNMLDRVMRGMNRYFDRGQHLHGSAGGVSSCTAGRGRCCTNFRPWHPATARANDGWRSPAERLNRHRYHDDWLQNLLISASLGGYRSTPRPKLRDGQHFLSGPIDEGETGGFDALFRTADHGLKTLKTRATIESETPIRVHSCHSWPN